MQVLLEDTALQSRPLHRHRIHSSSVLLAHVTTQKPSCKGAGLLDKQFSMQDKRYNDGIIIGEAPYWVDWGGAPSAGAAGGLAPD